ncbi:AMP-binding protein [Tabrizicola sp. J26]|uniref:AMP-binding protein n=1 Tax=Alitabrizicola rongguiensis TaxID=2909234 RepID=UPI001F322454|nr:AMP-binding protein [Tabrizicola rongguiensis]MCF1708939.1 AMP-binding protein [Tabrizicola rongguiensis]
MTSERFRWHPAARIVTAEGSSNGVGADLKPVIPARPAAEALKQAMAAAAAGLAFRIGGDGPPPPPGPVIETLTSGSTGSPRRIRRAHASWIASFEVNARLFGLGPGCRVGIPGQLVQSLALYGSIETLHLGGELHPLDMLRPDHQAQAIQVRGIEMLYASPVQLRLITEAGVQLPSLRLVLCGGAKLDPATCALVGSIAPNARLCEFYGAAEASFITLSDPDTPEGSVGRVYPGTELDIRDGEIWVRSPYLFEGYAGDPGPAQWQEDWLSIGEYGRLEDGYLYLHGRAGRMVTVADQNVFPEAVESFLLSLPGVTRAAALARPDQRRGHVIEAFVAGGDVEAVLSACRCQLGPLAAPRRIHRIADWPLLPSGKTDLAALERALP